MNYPEWFDLIQKICDEKGIMFPVKGESALQERYLSCITLKYEINKNYLLGLKYEQAKRRN